MGRLTTSDGVHYGAKDVRRVKRKYNHVRSELQEKGTRSAKRRLKAISGCEKRFVHDQNHCISKKLATIDEDVSIYVLEDLSSMNMKRLKGKSNKTMRKWLSTWSYSDLEEKLIYKCQRNGIRVEFVDARYTSQKCSVCKTIDKASRKGNRYVCRHCGNSMHADKNAAINIRTATATLLRPRSLGRLQSISRMDGVPLANRRRSLWAEHSRPSLQACPEGR